jgi:hypothetical protein
MYESQSERKNVALLFKNEFTPQTPILVVTSSRHHGTAMRVVVETYTRLSANAVSRRTVPPEL